MRFPVLTLVFLIVVTAAACGRESRPDTPVEAFKAYASAVKQKDTTMMKNLLSADSIKMHEQEARAQNVPLDDIVKRETLVTEGQKVVEFRNEKIEGETATLEVKDAFGLWTTVPFVREENEWKINKKAFADKLQQQIDADTQQMDDFINQGKQTPQL